MVKAKRLHKRFGVGMTLTVRRTYDPQTVREIMIEPSMWATIAEDGQDPGEYSPDMKGTCWLVMRDGDELIALYALDQVNGVMLEIHAQVLHQHRKEYSGATGKAVLQWIVENTDVAKIIAWVPEIYPNVRDFTVSQGFQIEGTNRKSYLKNGELHDQWLLGITRDEINE